jgi:hypothetical protein
MTEEEYDRRTKGIDLTEDEETALRQDIGLPVDQAKLEQLLSGPTPQANTAILRNLVWEAWQKIRK